MQKKTILLFLTDNRITNQIQMKNTCPFYTGHYSRKKKQRGGWEHTFLETPPGISRFFILPLESPDKTKFLETAQNCYNPWKFQDLKPRTPGNSTWFFLDHPWKSQPLEIPLTISSIYTPGNSISSNPLPPCCFFSGTAHCTSSLKVIQHSRQIFYFFLFLLALLPASQILRTSFNMI